ncbi:hypothetical protein SAMN02745127_01049 [Oceanospirillum multiglobuliferum]|uniref:Histidine kinase N-terminal 7TM region domain-containing protein n=1 Tax=Oceanospirillum multiglobuliferum TaxID=64969 RepID=A0A1T4N8K7_9GAMM|nr:hypothetical protein [Oceanospirillum multiglobuliferum]OPX55875.1 hypothetical protein BTE48_06690 [Oceanospirillum multiglobuliferum]SJZ75541.1 hypothetical protein SAMN02745127_01049 [Oceanospirillum multiglobuliferum]
MTSDQIYFLAVAMLNLVCVFACFVGRDPDRQPKSIYLLKAAFMVYAISWFLYVFEDSFILGFLSNLAAVAFVWIVVVYSYKRCNAVVPWPRLLFMFLLHAIVHLYFSVGNNLVALLHTSSFFVPIAFLNIAYLFVIVKSTVTKPDFYYAITHIVMAVLIIMRSITLELFPDWYAFSSASSQVLWPAFILSSAIFAIMGFMEESHYKLKRTVIMDKVRAS